MYSHLYEVPSEYPLFLPLEVDGSLGNSPAIKQHNLYT